MVEGERPEVVRVVQAGALDLARIVEIFGTDEADHGVDLIGMPAFGEPIVAGFKRKLIPTVMSFSRKRRPPSSRKGFATSER